MAGSRLRVDVATDQVTEAFAELEQRTANRRPLFQDLGEHLLNSTRERFDAERSPDGDAWAPLSPRYRARKRRNANKILVRDGYLRDTLRYQAGNDGLELGSDRVYAATHQFGREKAGIPARPFLGLSAEDREDVLDIVREYLIEQ